MLLQQFRSYCKEQFPYVSAANSHLLLAVSGGLDSVVLTDLVAKTGFSFTIAHCNFQLRGEESVRDEAFVKSLAAQYNKEVIIRQFDTESYAAQHKLSIQEAARKLRYDWFLEILDGWKKTDVHSGNEFANLQHLTRNPQHLTRNPQPAARSPQPATRNPQPATRNPQPATYRYIVTAHHANDNIETLLFNFFRGTGISGLHGILPKQDKLIRPLLFAKREAIQQYALDNQLSWVEDSSNASDKYTRNFLRHQVIPAVKEIFANAEDNLLQNIARFQEAEQLYNQSVYLHKKKLLEAKGNEVHIPVLKLQKTVPLAAIIWEIIKEYNFTAAQVSEVEKLLDAENGKYVASSTHRIIRNRNWLIIAPVQTEAAAHILIEESDSEIIYENGTLTLKNIQYSIFNIPSANNIATLNAAHIRYPLLLRKWKRGDYFYPLGMKKKKKLSKFFIDLKLSKTDKEKVWVLETDKKIIWVIGYRIDDRFKITDSTKETLTITAGNATPQLAK